MSDNWHVLLAESDFPTEGKVTARLGGWHVLLVRVDGQYHAVNDRCTHQAAPISTGRVRRGVVMCPLHGARFDLASGHCLGAGYRDLRTFAVRLAAGMIEVAVPDMPPGIEERPVMPSL